MLLTASPPLSQLSLAPPLFSSAPASSSSSVTSAAFPPKSSTSHFAALRSSSQSSGGVVVCAVKSANNGFFKESSEKGEALHAMELALPLEKLSNDVAEDIDVQLTDFVGSEFLSEEEEASSVMMAVPKKRRSHTKTKIRKNIWKRKGYTAAMKAFSLAKSLLTGNSKSFFSDK